GRQPRSSSSSVAGTAPCKGDIACLDRRADGGTGRALATRGGAATATPTWGASLQFLVRRPGAARVRRAARRDGRARRAPALAGPSHRGARRVPRLSRRLPAPPHRHAEPVARLPREDPAGASSDPAGLVSQPRPDGGRAGASPASLRGTPARDGFV